MLVMFYSDKKNTYFFLSFYCKSSVCVRKIIAFIHILKHNAAFPWRMFDRVEILYKLLS